MKPITIKEAMKTGTGHVAIHGWVYRERKGKDVIFIIVRDSTDILQCVVDKSKVSAAIWTDAEKISMESSVEISGSIRPDKRAPSGYEIHAETLHVIQFSERYPITKDQSEEFLLDKRHLWLRSRRMVAIMKIRQTVLEAFREHYKKKGFVEFSPPILHPTQCEGGSTLFPVKYYEDTVYLTQSAQLYSEAMAFALERVFLISPCFRAEKSKTSRHLSEFWMPEMESTWMDFDGLLDDIEGLLTHIVQSVLKTNKEELAILERDVKKLECITPPFPRLTYREVIKLLKDKDGVTVPFGKDLRTVEEALLSKHFDKPVMVTRYPKEIMAFYKVADPQDPTVALCVDVIAPEEYGEIVGGSQRDLDVDAMKQELEKMSEKPDSYDWYFDTRRYGSVPHCGHGMGVERVVRWICGFENIKDAIPFPRTLKRFTP